MIGKKNNSTITAKHKYWKDIFTLLMDEDSMTGRSFWGWFKHRLEEFGNMELKVDKGFNIQTLLHNKHI